VQKLTEVAVAEATHDPAKGKRPQRMGDGQGLYLQISAGNTKSWLFRYMLRGRSREMGLGALGPEPYGATLMEARQRAARCRALLSQGLDPITARLRVIPAVLKFNVKIASKLRATVLYEAAILLVSARKVSDNFLLHLTLMLFYIAGMIQTREILESSGPAKKPLRVALAKVARTVDEAASALEDPILGGDLIAGGWAARLFHIVEHQVGQISSLHLRSLAEAAGTVITVLSTSQGRASASKLPSSRMACAMAVVQLIEIFDGAPPGRNNRKALDLCSLLWQQAIISFPKFRRVLMPDPSSWERHLRVALGQSREISSDSLNKNREYIARFIEMGKFKEMVSGTLPV
jgi:hypothetical protein